MYHVGTRDVRFLKDTHRYKYNLQYFVLEEIRVSIVQTFEVITDI
jgi:hypothetical protein